MDTTSTRNNRENAGSLTVVGTGIRTVGQLTGEAIAWMRVADSLLYVISEPIAEAVIKQLNPEGSESIAGYYKVGELRMDAYTAMVEHILRCVRAGDNTVVAFYGHPGVFAYPSHESIRRARAEGFPARMLPAVSAEDCLFADLGVDPSTGGCHSYEATDFLVNAEHVDASSQLILWQIGILGDWTYKSQTYDTRAMPLLVDKLTQSYPADHVVTLYQAAWFPGAEPVIDRIALHSLVDFPVRPSMTMYIPPARPRIPNPDMLAKMQSVLSDEMQRLVFENLADALARQQGVR